MAAFIGNCEFATNNRTLLFKELLKVLLLAGTSCVKPAAVVAACTWCVLSSSHAGVVCPGLHAINGVPPARDPTTLASTADAWSVPQLRRLHAQHGRANR